MLEGGQRIEAHPGAGAFPLMPEDDRLALAVDIKANGQRVSVIVLRLPSGKVIVLDGRSRLWACEDAGIKPTFHYVDPDTDAVSVILSANLYRGHRTESQRAMVAARVANLSQGRPAIIASIEAITQQKAAGLLKIGRASVQRAKAVLKDPILTAAVDDGHATVNDAYAIRKEPESAKKRAVAAVARGEARTLKQALAQEAPGTPRGDLASEDSATRRLATPSEFINPVSNRADTTEPSDTSALPEPASDSPTKPEPVETSNPVSKGSEEHRGAVPSESSSPLRLFDRSDTVERPEDAVQSGSAFDSKTEREAVGIPTAVPGPELGQELAAPADERGGADASSDSPPPLVPASNDVPAKEATDLNVQDVNDAMAARAGDGTILDVRRCVQELRAAADRLDSVRGIQKESRFQAACHLVQTLASAMEQCVEAGMDDRVLVADLPGHVVSSLDAQLVSELGHEHSDTSVVEGGFDVGERPVSPSTAEQARKRRTWLRWPNLSGR